MRRFVIPNILKCLLAATVLPLLGLSAETEAPSPGDLASSQDRGANRLSELESRLHALAMLLREDEPEDAGRLMLALRASRRERLREEMDTIRSLLDDARTTQAAQRADALVANLQDLRELLTAPNIRFRLQLERLRNLLKSKESLDAIRAAQERLREETAAAKANANRIAPRQSDLGDRTAELATAMANEMAASQASRQAVGKAQQAMGQAAKSLGQGSPQEATPKQDEALANLRQAEQNLQDEIEQLRQQMEAEVRAVVMATLKAMLTDEEMVLAATGSGDFGAGVVDRQRRVADEAQQITNLINETAYSAALPVVLNEIDLDSRAAAADLKNTIPTQKRIADTLRSLIETLEDRPPPQPPQNNNADNQQQQQQQKQQEDLQKLIAELKMLHFLESRLIKDTVAAEAEAERAAATPLRRRQVKVLDALRALQQELREKQQQ